MYYIGIDLGTSAVKLLLVDENGGIRNEVTREYPLEFPQPGWSQQAPEDWKKAVLEGIPALLSGFDAGQVAGIGCGGQMHGLVVLDDRDQVIRPAILWNDGRTAAEVDYLNGEVGKEKLSALTANIAFAGFTAPKLLWMRKNEPENFAKIAKIMLPVWVCLLVSTVRAIRRDMKKEKAGDLSKEETDERMGINALVLFFSFAFTVGCLAALTSF